MPYYHGSSKLIDGYLEPRSSRVIDNEKAVFATPSKEFALAFMGEKWNDNDFDLGSNGRYLHMVERRRGNFEKFFNVDGYLYKVNKSGFRSDKRLGMPDHEVICDDNVKILSTQYIPNILNALRKSKIVMIKYDDLKFIRFKKGCKKVMVNTEYILSLGYQSICLSPDNVSYTSLWKDLVGRKSNEHISKIGVGMVKDSTVYTIFAKV
jgi:hypothetical protein